MKKVILTSLSLLTGIMTSLGSTNSTPSKEEVRENLRIYQLEIIQSGRAKWPRHLEDLSDEDKLKLQLEQMDRIRKKEPALIIPLTKKQITELEEEGHFPPKKKFPSLKK